MWDLLLVNPTLNLLAVLYNMTGNLGVSLILFTTAVKFLVLPFALPQMKMTKKQQDIQPELNELKAKFKHDKKKQAEMQMEIFKKHGINPAAGCLTTIFTLLVMIAVYSSVRLFTLEQDISKINSRMYSPKLTFESRESINSKFLYLDLAKPDKILIIPIISVILQFLATKMIMPYNKELGKVVKKTPEKEDDFMYAMQQQNLYVMPLMFFFFGITLPSGVMIYIVVSTLLQIIQTWYFNGWGGVTPWVDKLYSKLGKA